MRTNRKTVAGYPVVQRSWKYSRGIEQMEWKDNTRHHVLEPRDGFIIHLRYRNRRCGGQNLQTSQIHLHL